ncbi:phage portal protein family protein, partial [Flavobacterium psychrophilum]
MLNKAVSHVLFKRFAQSCWSELCEIYGIPPRVLKT